MRFLANERGEGASAGVDLIHNQILVALGLVGRLEGLLGGGAGVGADAEALDGLALGGHGHPPLGYMPLGSQMSAHCDGLDAPGVWSTHWPSAVARRYLSAGHGCVGEHSGEQKEPGMP